MHNPLTVPKNLTIMTRCLKWWPHGLPDFMPSHFTLHCCFYFLVERGEKPSTFTFVIGVDLLIMTQLNSYEKITIS